MSVTNSQPASAPDKALPLPRVAFQGVAGAFSELAIRQHWPLGAEALPERSFTDAVNSVLNHRADFAVIPVENAIVGTVHIALEALNGAGDQLVRHHEFQLDIRFCLMAPPGATLAGIRQVLSHPVALAQCRLFFQQHPWLAPVPHIDTGSAASDVAAAGDVHTGAIASDVAAALYKLQIIARDVEDIRSNWTRFLVVSAR